MSGIFSHILVGIDDSAASADAIAIGLRLAREHGSQLTFSHSVNWLPAISEIEASGAIVDPAPVIDELMEAGRTLLARTAEEAKRSGVDAQQRLLEGEPAECMLDVARDAGCSLIVVGTHGRKGLEHLFLGSTTEAVLRGSTIPVLTVRAGLKLPAESSRCFARIIVGVDDSEPSAAALAAVLSFPAEDLRHVLLCGVAGTALAFGGREYRRAVADDLREPVEHVVDAALANARSHGIVAAEGQVLTGNADSALIAAAAQDGADLIVVGSHGRRGIRRYLLGSVAEAIVRAAPVPVLVVRTAAAARAAKPGAKPQEKSLRV